MNSRKKYPASLKISDVCRFLRTSCDMIKLRVSNKDKLIQFLHDLDKILVSHKNEDASIILDALQKSLPKEPDIVSTPDSSQLKMNSDISLEEIKNLLKDLTVGRQQLINIAHNRLGIPPGRLSRLSALKLREEIEAAISNLETLDTIGRVASGETRD